MGALSHIRICDFTGQLAGAGATRTLAAFGAQVIRIEDPVTRGGWDILRGMSPFVDERRGIELGGGFQNHNVEKLGITLNLRTERGKALLRRLVAISDVVAENFAAGVLARLGFSYEAVREIRPDVVYVSHSGFGQRGPYSAFKTWGPIVQAVCGLSVTSGLPEQPPAGWGYSYMDHQGANLMAVAILAGLVHRARTGEGQWLDMSCTDAGAALLGPVVLDYTVNGRPFRRSGMPHSNRSQSPAMAPHGIYPSRGDDCWVALACRDDRDWRALKDVIADPRLADERFDALRGRLTDEDALDAIVGAWTRERDKFAAASALQGAGVPAAAVQTPRERIDEDPATADWGLWPVVDHPEMGRVRVDGLPVHLGATDWRIARGAPLLGQHNDYVYGELLGLRPAEIDELRVHQHDFRSEVGEQLARVGRPLARELDIHHRDDDLGFFRRLVRAADVVLEGEPPGTLAERRIDYDDLVRLRPDLIMTTVTPFGRRGPRAREQATDLTLLAAGGPVWSCGYDDHALPPIRGGGNQSLHMGGVHAVTATLVAVLHRAVASVGQHIDVSLYAAANVTTEAATYEWLVARQTVERQTCRHASTHMTASCIAADVEGCLVHTGVPPRSAKEFTTLLAWLHDLGLSETFPEAVFLEMGRDRGGIRLADIATDVETQEIFRAGRDALVFIASRMRAADFFVEGQRRGLAVGVLNAPEDVMQDPHFIARGFPTRVHHDDLGCDVLYPGAPFLSDASPWRIRRRAPRLGEHDAKILGPLREGQG